MVHTFLMTNVLTCWWKCSLFIMNTSSICPLSPYLDHKPLYIAMKNPHIDQYITIQRKGGTLCDVDVEKLIYIQVRLRVMS